MSTNKVETGQKVSLLEPVETKSTAQAPLFAESFKHNPAGGLLMQVTPEPQRGYRRAVNPERKRLQVKKDINLASGSLRFNLQKLKNGPKPGRPAEYDTVFALADGAGRLILTAYVVTNVPDTFAGKADSGINFYSQVLPDNVWGLWWPFPRDIAPGEKYTLEFQWDEKRTYVYLNGTLLREHYADFFGKVTWPGFVSYPGGFFKDVRHLQLGADTLTGDNSPLDGNLILDYAIY